MSKDMPPKKKPQPPVHVLPTPAKSKEVSPPKSVSSVDETPRTKLAAGKAKSTVVACSVCTKSIIEGKEQALLCEGECKQWVHRCCAGIPVTAFEVLTSSPAPFFCLLCSQRMNESEIAGMKATILLLKQEILEMQKEIRSRKIKANTVMDTQPPLCLNSVQTQLDALNGWSVHGSRHQAGDPHISDGEIYEGGVRGGGGRGRGRGGGRGRGASRSGGGGDGATGGERGGGGLNVSESGAIGDGGRKVKVDGARRVWGTMRVCTEVTVKSVIERCCGIKTVRVRRKTSTRGGQHWWFVLHADEAVLSSLEENWKSVELQTSWKLQLCHKNVPVNQLLQPIENVVDNYVNHTNTAIDVTKATVVATAAANHVDPEYKPDLNIHASLSECLPVQTPFETRSNACLSLNGPSSTADALYQLNPPPSTSDNQNKSLIRAMSQESQSD